MPTKFIGRLSVITSDGYAQTKDTTRLMTEISPLEAGQWLARMAAADGVVSANEKKLLWAFARKYGLDANQLLQWSCAVAATNEPEVEYVTAAEMKGRQFENFIVSMLQDKNRFQLLSWRGDKIFDKTYAEENLLPDLRIRHALDAAPVTYHLECKYRSMLPDGVLDLTAQLGRYRRMTMNIDRSELFFAIGIGGKPSDPEQLYIIPNRMIRRDYIIKIQNFGKCLCAKTPEAFHAYINHYYAKRVFKTI